MAVIYPFKGSLKFSVEFFSDPLAKDLGDLIGTEKSHSQFTGATEEFADGEGSFEDKVEAIFHLTDCIEAMEV